MAITIEHLDDYHKETDFIVIVGESILLKFIPGKSFLVHRPELKDIINISNLLISEELKKVKKIVRLSNDLKHFLGQYLQSWITDKKSLPTYRSKMRENSISIAEIEKDINFSLSDSHLLYFCNQCAAYVGEVDNLTTTCPACRKSLQKNEIEQLSYLDSSTTGFLEGGIWFEDYMARLLNNLEWKVWTHGQVMGVSGVLHPVDLLAIKEGKILIAECKVGRVYARDISHFMIQKYDIPSHFGFFLSFTKCSSKSNVALLQKSASILVDEIEGKNDLEIVKQIDEHVKKFS